LLDSFAEKARQAGRHPSRLSMPALHDFRKALDRLNAAIRFLAAPTLRTASRLTANAAMRSATSSGPPMMQR
jgi:hypothetical protein